MQTLTFTQKLLRQRSFLTALIPLFALFLGLGSVTKVNAQAATFSGQQVVVNQGNGNVTYPATTFNGTTLVNQTPPGTQPLFDINGVYPVLDGGSVTITGTGTTTGITGASLTYQVVDVMGTPVPGGSGTLTMSTTSPAGNTRTFTVTGANISLVSPIATPGTYYVGVSYSASYTKTGFPAFGNLSDPAGPYYAQFDVTGTKTAAPTVNPNTIQFSTDNNAANSYFFPNNPGSTPQFPNYTFMSSTNAGGVNGAFDINTGQLRLTNTTVSTTEAGGNMVSSVVLYYRTRLASSGGGAFQSITLTQSGPISGGTRLFVIDPNDLRNSNGQPNLIATPAVTAVGNYKVDVYYQANGVDTSTGNSFTITYPPTGNYTANFTVAGTPIATTIWTGAVNDNWFDLGNWSNGVPNAITNALIRDLGTGSAPYPNIYSSTVRTTAGGALIYDNTTSGPAKVRTLTMGGSSQAQRSITRLIVGQLQVYGDFNNTFDSFIQRSGTIVEFAGSTSPAQNPSQVYYNAPIQTITGGTFQRVDISGNGKKLLTGVMSVEEAINFLTPSVSSVNTVTPNPFTPLAADAGILATDIATPSSSVVVLTDRTSNNSNNGAQINGETDISYIYGFVRTSRANVGPNDPRTFGNIGMDLVFTGVNGPGNIDVTRNTVEAYKPVSGKYGVRRIFGVRPTNPTTNSFGLQATMVFHYRTSETQMLNGPTLSQPGTSSIPEPQLTIFLSTTSGNSFSLIGRDGPVNTSAKTVTKSGVSSFATFTLGDQLNPLPVRLTAFDAKRMGSNALVTWQTASEVNSKGYEVQVSTNGTEFRTLAMVASAAPNSAIKQSYSYEDTESNKAGIRYYRLHQLDMDGKDAYFAPLAVSFDGKTSAATDMVAYPNPFNSNDELHVALKSSVVGTGKLIVADMTGRIIAQQSVNLNLGLTDLSVAGLGDLKAGLYMVKVTLPSGEVKNLKVMKQ